MKLTTIAGLFTLTASVLFTANGNAQVEPQSQPSFQQTCVAVKPSEPSTTQSKPPSPQRSTQVQQSSECALNPQLQPVQTEAQLPERDRLIKERFEQRIIPPQD